MDDAKSTFETKHGEIRCQHMMPNRTQCLREADYARKSSAERKAETGNELENETAICRVCWHLLPDTDKSDYFYLDSPDKGVS